VFLVAGLLHPASVLVVLLTLQKRAVRNRGGASA